MIQANELRIGNWVNNNEEDYQITSATIVQLERGDSTVVPIPLTEEWLVRFGFRYYKSNNSYDLDSEFGFTLWGRVKSGFNLYLDSEELGETFRYVHQLQNLYFALTQTELKPFSV